MKKNVGISYKAFAVILAAVLILGGTIGGTMAWLIDGAKAVENTFTDSDISIELKESDELDLKMIPGYTIKKDPKVTVAEGSEDCYLFVKIEESENYDTYLEYAIDKNVWTELDGENSVYYTTVAKDAEKREFSILAGGSLTYEEDTFEWADNQVLVKPEVTKSQMNEIKEEGKPTLTFTAYAVQLYKTNNQVFDVTEAWEKADALGNQTTPEA